MVVSTALGHVSPEHLAPLSDIKVHLTLKRTRLESGGS